MKQFLLFVFLISASLQSLEGKVHIFSHNVDYLIFMSVQYNALKKYLKDDYIYYVINDANTTRKSMLDKRCKYLHIPVINIPAEIKAITQSSFRESPINLRCMYTSALLEHIIKTITIKPDDIIVWLPANMFPVKDCSFQNMMKDYDLMGIMQPSKILGLMPNMDLDYFLLKESALQQQLFIGFQQIFLDGRPMQIGEEYFYYIPIQKHLHFKLINKAQKTNTDLHSSIFYDLVKNQQNKIVFFDDAWIRYVVDWASCPEKDKKFLVKLQQTLQ